MLKIAIITGTTRPGRKNLEVAKWVKANADNRQDAVYEIVDIAEFNLPLLDESIPAGYGQYENAHTKIWASRIAEYDGFVFVTPEYNHSFSPALKNAIDYIYAEWNNKAAGFVSYGSAYGVRAVEQLRQIMAELQVADVRNTVMLSLFTDFENFATFKPDPRHEANLNGMLDQLIAWSGALKPLRK